jgi:hypothetical protein
MALPREVRLISHASNPIPLLKAPEAVALPKTVTPDKPPEAAPGAQAKLVQVHEGQCLSELCTETLGKFRPEDLREIMRMNPDINDPNVIKPGQWISLPVRPPDSTDKQ